MEKIPLPKVETASEGFRVHLKQLIAALGVEFRLLRAERGLILLVPLALFVSTMELAFYPVTPEVSYSGAYASSTAGTLLLFLLGLTVFYTGEAMHRDRETRVEPVLWSLPVPNHVFLLSKFLATLLLSLFLIVLIGLTAIALQLLKGDRPVEISAYLTIYGVILIPSLAFVAAASIALNVLLRDKYLTYAVSVAIGGGLYYLYGHGYNHWLYNPVLYQLWSYAQLVTSEKHWQTVLLHRSDWLAIAIACLALAHLCYNRRTGKSRASIFAMLTSPLIIFLVAVITAVVGGILVARQIQ